MEIVKSRYGLDRSIERIDHSRVRVMGESQFVRTSKNKNGDVLFYDMEGGPAYTVGGKLSFEKMNWKIKNIVPYQSRYQGLHEAILFIEPIY